MICPDCGYSMTAFDKTCPRCPISSKKTFQYPEKEKIQTVLTKDNDSSVLTSPLLVRILGILGALLLFFGTFSPIMTVPLIGTKNYVGTEGWVGTILIILSIVALLFASLKATRWLFVPATVSAYLLIHDLTMFQYSINMLRGGSTNAQSSVREVTSNLAGAIMAESFRLEWGWPVMITSVVLITISSVLGYVRQNDKSVSIRIHKVIATSSVLVASLLGFSFGLINVHQMQKESLMDQANKTKNAHIQTDSPLVQSSPSDGDTSSTTSVPSPDNTNSDQEEKYQYIALVKSTITAVINTEQVSLSNGHASIESFSQARYMLNQTMSVYEHAPHPISLSNIDTLMHDGFREEDFVYEDAQKLLNSHGLSDQYRTEGKYHLENATNDWNLIIAKLNL